MTTTTSCWCWNICTCVVFSVSVWRFTDAQLEEDIEMIWDTFRSFQQDESLKTMNKLLATTTEEDFGLISMLRREHWIQAISQAMLFLEWPRYSTQTLNLAVLMRSRQWVFFCLQQRLSFQRHWKWPVYWNSALRLAYCGQVHRSLGANGWRVLQHHALLAACSSLF